MKKTAISSDSVGNEENTSTHSNTDEGERLYPETTFKAGSACTLSSTGRMKILRRSFSLPSEATSITEPEDVELDMMARLSDQPQEKFLSAQPFDNLTCFHSSLSKSSKSTHFHDVHLSQRDATCNHACFPSTSYAGSSCISFDSVSTFSHETEKADHFQEKFLDLYIYGEGQEEIKHKPQIGRFSYIANMKNSIADYDESWPCSFDKVTSYVSRLNCPENLAMLRASRCSSMDNTSSTDVDDKHLNRPFSPSRDSMSDSGCSFECLTVHNALDSACSHIPLILVEEYGIDFYSKLKEVEERAMIVLKELCQKRFFLCGSHISMPTSLYHKIRRLTEEQRELLQKMTAQLQLVVLERNCLEERLLLIKQELTLKIQSLEKEKSVGEGRFQREMEIRDNRWAFKLERLKLEHQRLRDQMKQLVQHNVCLQRDISHFYSKDLNQTVVGPSSMVELQLNEKVAGVESHNLQLQDALSWAQRKLRIAERETSIAKKHCEEKSKENKKLFRLVTMLQEKCFEEETAIVDGLGDRLNLMFEGNWSPDGVDAYMAKLEMKNSRLGTQRKDSTTHQCEKLDRLGGFSEMGSSSSIKLEQELFSHILCLQNLGLSLVNETIKTIEELLSVLLYRRRDVNSRHDQKVSVAKEFLEEYTVMDYDMKIKGYKLRASSLQRSASVLKERTLFDNESNSSSEEEIKSKLKAEMLVTNVLKEKMYSQQQQTEQVRSDLSSSLRNHQILKNKIQRAIDDDISSMNHQLEDMEIQLFKKNSLIDQLQRELQLTMDELSHTRKLASELLKERDSIWEELKRKSEESMLLNYEIISLRKKVEALEEDTLVKDGQITILKDSLRSKSFDFLSDYG